MVSAPTMTLVFHCIPGVASGPSIREDPHTEAKSFGYYCEQQVHNNNKFVAIKKSTIGIPDETGNKFPPTFLYFIRKKCFSFPRENRCKEDVK